MCVICDGQTQEQAARFIELTIIQHGWALRHVHPGADDPTGGHWTYTIGLVENFNHPELVITDTEYEVAGSLLNALGEEIRSGHEISSITESGFELNEVHPAHLASELFYGWADNYEPSRQLTTTAQATPNHAPIYEIPISFPAGETQRACDHMVYNMYMARKQVLVQLDEDLIVALDRLAAAEGTNRSELLRRGGRAVVRAATLATEDRKLVQAYKDQPQDSALLEGLAQQAAAVLPPW